MAYASRQIDLSDSNSTFYIHELIFRDVSGHCEIEKFRMWIDDHKNDLKVEEQKRVARMRYPECELEFELKLTKKNSKQLTKIRRKARQNYLKGGK